MVNNKSYNMATKARSTSLWDLKMQIYASNDVHFIEMNIIKVTQLILETDTGRKEREF